jgi:FlaA1/EpsC-like NDP-sugar epimerase
MVSFDLFTFPFALWIAYVLRLSQWWPEQHLGAAWSLFVATAIMGVASFAYFGVYRVVVRYMTGHAVLQVCKGVLITTVVLYVCASLGGLYPFPRSVPVIFALVAFLYLGGARLLVHSYHYWLVSKVTHAEPVIIYGAGATGAKLLSVLKGTEKFTPVAFVDDNPRLEGSTVGGIPVYTSDGLQPLIEDSRVVTVLLALPALSLERRKEIIETLGSEGLNVLTVPSMSELLSGRSLGNLREVEIEDLLGRDIVPPKQELIDKSVTDKVVLITGAGGSIGSEIARQVMVGGARQVLLLDSSEFSLYQIERDLVALKECDQLPTELVPLLGSVLEQGYIEKVLQRFKVDTVYHAAAYKHVPLVEHNIVNGVRNNVLGTQAVLKACLAQKISRFILISTDKAVRPTNIMGASKRLAEMLVQNTQNIKTETVCSMVRFGNVLGSSGSVVPLFKEQIAADGPVTVTHPDMTRYFMTIQEAASLVIQAGSMARGGEVFLLDMGEPVKVVELARTMIRLSGKTLKDASNPQGDVEIKFSGLRPGEKLYEELLIGDAEEGTEHPKILKAHEQSLAPEELENLVARLNGAIGNLDSAEIKTLLAEAVKGYQLSQDNVDWSQGTSVTVKLISSLTDQRPYNTKH